MTLCVMKQTHSMFPPLRSLDGRAFDVVVIGGGIVGAAAAREAASAGYSVLIAEKSDFATGATSRSSRLLHCGLRYFETPRPMRTFARRPRRLATALRMARQAMQSRHEFVKTAPERLVPVEMLLPIYKGGDFLPWQVDLGFAMLSRMAPRDVPLNYRRLSRDAALAHPLGATLSRPERLHSAAVFTEYRFDWPERICIDALLDARELGATALNYAAARLGGMRDDGSRTVRLVGADGESAEVSGRRVLVMAGLWIDRVLRAADPQAPRKTFGTKGAHIVVRLPDTMRGKGVATMNEAGEPFYCLPQGELHYIGPTETVYEGDPDEIRCDEEDIGFLLDQARALFPGLHVRREDVIRTWAGVRPLTYDPDAPKGARSRELHDLAGAGLTNVWAMTAAPIMTHRDAGRDVVRALRAEIAPSGPSREMEWRRRMPLGDVGSPRLHPEEEAYRLADVPAAVREEGARTLADLLFRRVGVGWRRFFTDEQLVPIAAVMGDELGWSEERRSQEIRSYQQETRRLFGPPGN